MTKVIEKKTMMQKLTNFFLLFGVIIIVLFLMILFIWLGWNFIVFFKTATPNIKASLIGVGSAIFAAIMTHYYSQQREIRARHFTEKSKAYSHIFDLIFDMMRNVKKDKQFSEEEMLERFFTIKKSLMVWGNQDVLNAWSKFESEATLNEGNDSLINMDSIIREIRKDLGHDDSTIPQGGFLVSIIVEEDKEKLLKAAESKQ